MTDDTPPPATSAAETPLWEGSPSQWQNLWWFVSCILIITIPIAIWKWLVLKNYRISLTTQRLRIRSGVLSKHNEDVELYRVKDWTLQEPFLMRILGKGVIDIVSSDRTAPELHLKWIPEAPKLLEHIRAAVEARRDTKRVRELDVGDGDMDLEG